MIKKIIFILLLLIYTTSSASNYKFNINTKTHINIEYTVSMLKEYIKSHENPKRKFNCHNDGNGNMTIAYGHKVTLNDIHLIKSNNITEKVADSLLDSDINKVLRFIDRKYVWLNSNQRMAACHIGFCLGIGTLIKVIENGCDLNSNKLVKYSYCNNKVNKNILNQRLFEIQLWNK